MHYKARRSITIAEKFEDRALHQGGNSKRFGVLLHILNVDIPTNGKSSADKGLDGVLAAGTNKRSIPTGMPSPAAFIGAACSAVRELASL